MKIEEAKRYMERTVLPLYGASVISKEPGEPLFPLLFIELPESKALAVAIPPPPRVGRYVFLDCLRLYLRSSKASDYFFVHPCQFSEIPEEISEQKKDANWKADKARDWVKATESGEDGLVALWCNREGDRLLRVYDKDLEVKHDVPTNEDLTGIMGHLFDVVPDLTLAEVIEWLMIEACEFSRCKP